MNPNRFTCSKWSPVDPPVWSTGQPSVALTHIFCGQINDDGEAEGFHSRPRGKNPKSATVLKGVNQHNNNPLLCYKEEKVRNARKDVWVERTGHQLYCFFPKKWTIKKTVEILQGIYNECKNKITSKAEMCKSNYNQESFDVIIFFNRERNEIVSAFATPLGKNSACNSKSICK